MQCFECWVIGFLSFDVGHFLVVFFVGMLLLVFVVEFDFVVGQIVGISIQVLDFVWSVGGVMIGDFSFFVLPVGFDSDDCPCVAEFG